MSLLSDMKAYLIAQGIGTADNVFTIEDYKTLPDSPEHLIWMDEYRGSPAIHTHDGKRIINTSILVLVRGAAGPVGSAAAIVTKDAIDALLDGKSNTTIGSIYCLNIRAQSPPITYGTVSKGRPMWEQNFNIMRR